MLLQLAKQAQLKSSSALTFNIKDVEIKVANNGNTGFRVTTDQEKVITFWSNQLDSADNDPIIEELDDKGNFRVLPGTQVTKEGNLIPGNLKQSGGFWD